MAQYRIFSIFIIHPLRRCMNILPRAKYPNLHQSVAQNRSQPILQNPTIPFVDGAKRLLYSLDKNKFHYFKPPYPSSNGYKRWTQNPSKVLSLFCGVSITAYFYLTETVPYTNRPQCVIFSKFREKRRSESWFEEIKSKYEGKIVENVRVQKIASNIVEAHKGLRKEPQSVMLAHEVEEKETVTRKMRWLMVSLFNKLGKRKSQTLHLEGFKWEVIVVDDPVVNAYCMPNGKIVVSTGLLDFFKEDAEIATIIAHEVGHAVARHYAEKFSKFSWMGILRCYFYQLPSYNVYNCDDKVTNSLTMRIFSPRMEMEADYIGILLMACAGYDPGVAPQVYEKMGNYGCNTKEWDKKFPLLQGYLGNHPGGNQRSKLLSKAKVMEEALSIYTNNAAPARPSYS